MNIPYRWIIVFLGGLMGCVAIGAMFSLAVFLDPMSAETGWSRAGISTAMTLDFLIMGVAGFLWGTLSDRYGPRPVVLIGHSLSVAAIVLTAQRLVDTKVRGAFLVSPPDFDSDAIPATAKPFKPPTDPLPFPSMVVASTSDPLVTVERATGFAADWGSDFKLAGDAGHINAASGHGPWPEGLLMFTRLMQRI